MCLCLLLIWYNVGFIIISVFLIVISRCAELRKKIGFLGMYWFWSLWLLKNLRLFVFFIALFCFVAVQLGSLINFEEREVERMRWTNFVLKLACMLVLLLFGECSFYFRRAYVLIIHYVLSCVLKQSIRCKLILFCVLKLKLLINLTKFLSNCSLESKSFSLYEVYSDSWKRNKKVHAGCYGFFFHFPSFGVKIPFSFLQALEGIYVCLEQWLKSFLT